MKNIKLKKLMLKGDVLLEEELDIIRILKSIRKLKKEEKNRYIIDLDYDINNSNISYFEDN